MLKGFSDCSPGSRSVWESVFGPSVGGVGTAGTQDVGNTHMQVRAAWWLHVMCPGEGSVQEAKRRGAWV